MSTRTRLKSLSVSRLRDRDTLHLKFFPDINFIIGRNGTGKTTVMNLISAILGFNAETIGRIPFHKAHLTLESIDDTKRNIDIFVEKLSAPEMKRPEITFKIKDGKDQIEFDFDYIGDGRYLRYELPVSARRRSAEDTARYHRFLASRVNYSWLPIQRADNLNRYASPEEREMTPLDRKIRHIVVDMTKYLSSLDTKATSIVNQFQQEYFLSMLDYQAPKTSETVPVDLLEQSLFSIFDEFNVPRALYRERIVSHMKRLQSDQNIDARRLLLADTARLYALALKWQEFDQRRAEIYRPKDEFVDIFNRLFLNKAFSFDERNQPTIRSRTNNEERSIDLDELSSGEKQMLIIVGETLLQEQNDFIFLADEPELSLHIEWQRDLVSNIRKLNPRCQLLFATHSPDIVERYGDRTLDLENFTSVG